MEISLVNDLVASVSTQILMLETRLRDQVSVRCALENALGYRSSSRVITDAAVIPKVVGLSLTKFSLAVNCLSVEFMVYSQHVFFLSFLSL